MKYTDGSQYMGPYEHGRCCGKNGQYTSAEGSVAYQGDWKFGQYHGRLSPPSTSVRVRMRVYVCV
jgi:hypothetical protein